ncbi:hypothetical protein OQA88_11363 [Cercophora sp. LCS_1]
MASPLPIILYHYPFSPYARRVVWYLRLRGIPYTECLQPPILPRPDLALLGLSYRRIPTLTLGTEIYLDTRLILSKLNSHLQSYPSIAPTSPTHLTTTRLLSLWTTTTDLFTRAQHLLPFGDLPLLKDPAFQRDRLDFNNGKRTSRDEALLLRAEALVEIREGLELLEGQFAWVERFQGVVSQKKGTVGRVNGEEAARMIREAGWVEEEGTVDKEDPVVKLFGLTKGDLIEVWPTDSGSGHVDSGRLVAMGREEVVWETERGYRVHAPRKGFRVKPKERGANL